MNDYEHLRELAEKATPGPWEARKQRSIGDLHKTVASVGRIPPIHINVNDGTPAPSNRDAEFIAAANPDTIRNLLEDLRMTRQERDQEKHKNLALSKDNALLQRALEAVEGYVGRLEHERAALRRGQGRAPEPASPEHPPFHHTHPIPDSTKGE